MPCIEVRIRLFLYESAALMTRPRPLLCASWAFSLAVVLLWAASPARATASTTANESFTATASRTESAIDDYARKHDFSGTILVQDGTHILYNRSFGLADRAFAVPADNTTRYRIASITKLFTSVLILQLHDQGRLDIDGKLKTYLPDYPGEGAEQVTLHHLLNHTSGIEQFDRVASLEEALMNGVEQYQRPLTTDALLKRCCSSRLVRKPGTGFDYNNADYVVLGKVIERITGKTYEEALTERILRPLGLRDTGLARQDAIVSRLANTYFYRDDTGTMINDLPFYFQNWYAAGAMYSTAPDLLAFANSLYGGRLLKAETLDRMLKPGLDDYGYGLWSYSFERGGKKHKVAKRPGSIMGSNVVLYRLLERKATVVILGNTNRTDLDSFAQRIGSLLVE